MVLLPVFIGSFFVLKDKTALLSLTVFQARYFISKCVIVSETYNSFPTYIWFTSVL